MDPPADRWRPARVLLACLPLALASVHRVVAAPVPAAEADPRASLLEAHRLYFAGQHEKALAAYERAAKQGSAAAEAWANGALVWSESGRDQKAAEWLEKAERLNPGEAEIRIALAETRLRLGELEAARSGLAEVLASRPDDPFALLAAGRVELAAGKPGEAIARLEKAAAAAPKLTLAHYWLGRARSEAADDPGALEAYKKAAYGDSYFTEARFQLARAFSKVRRFYEAWEQARKLLESAPKAAEYRRLEEGARKRLGAGLPPPKRVRTVPVEVPPPGAQPPGRVPVLRIGLGTTAMGKPAPRLVLRFSADSRFSVFEPGSPKPFARGGPEEVFLAAVSAKKPWRVELRDVRGKVLGRSRKGLLVRPEPGAGASGVVRLLNFPYESKPGNGMGVRGELEVSLVPGRKSLRIVSVLDLESYTHGVIAAEMPIVSPMEALKAQAVVARTHALYIQTVTRRHKSDGYDLCDGQHCQVYAGLKLESERSRAVVEATRGRVVAYQGRVAHVLYASNCGGHTQSGREVQGWGDVPYWVGVPDAPLSVKPPRTPWELRLWLRSSPPAYCRPSSFVHPSHFRWSRVVPAAELSDQLNRSLKTGKLRAIVPLKRSVSGHLNSVRVAGSRATLTLSKELRLRSLLGVGSQRSALFLVETERDKKGNPVRFVFYGGGWGHGVGMCQSGAMGRAEEGQSYGDILAAYYPGTELGNLRY